MIKLNKQNIYYFPLWKPHYRTEEKFSYTDNRGYKALRNSSSAFIKREDVRNYLLSKYKYKCVKCECTKNLEVDHIISVYMAFKHKEFINELNSESNLQILCNKCNASKSPEQI